MENTRKSATKLLAVILAVACLAALCLTGCGSPEKMSITIVDGINVTELEMENGTVADALSQAGITISDGMTADHELTEKLSDGMIITVSSASKATVTMNLYGRNIVVETTAKTVGELLDEQGVSPAAGDSLSVGEGAAITDGMTITLEKTAVPQSSEITPDSKETSEPSSQPESKPESKPESSKKPSSSKRQESSKPEESSKPTESKPSQSSKPEESSKKDSGDKTIVSKQRVDDCDGSGHGYYIITYSDGSVEYEDY